MRFSASVRHAAVAAVLLASAGWSVEATAATPPLPEKRKIEVPLPLSRPAGLAPSVDQETAVRYRDAFILADKRDWSGLDRERRAKPDPLLEKVLDWLRLRDPAARTTATLLDFLENNPDWPDRWRLVRQIEDDIDDIPLVRRARWFEENPPRTGSGWIAYIDVLETVGREADAARAVREAWREADFDSTEHRLFVEAHGHKLDLSLHRDRLDRLLWRGAQGQAERMLDLVDEDHKLLAIARMRLRQRAHGVDAAIERVPDALRDHPGLVYEQLRWRHRSGMRDRARELIWNTPLPPDEFRELWWRERALQVRDALDEERYEDAYRISAEHVQLRGVAFADAEWLAGWIALRFVDRPRDAVTAFENLHSGVGTPISLARAAYWAGRAHSRLGDATRAEQWYRRAAEFPTTFYGQLGAAQLPGAGPALPAEPIVSPADQSWFETDEMVLVSRALARAGQHRLAHLFIAAIVHRAESAGQARLLAGLARELGSTKLGVRVARNAARDNHILVADGYPLRDLPGIADQASARREPEPALVHAVIRQESEFDLDAVSRAGARGLMQLMPGTARDTARKTGLPYTSSRLTSDGDYNVRLGSAYLAGLLDRYEGFYVLAVAAYNAGPGNVNRWIEAHGDPRSPTVDVIDWIERIPFSETRNYVQRVLEGLQVYRLRYGRHTLSENDRPAFPSYRWCVTSCAPPIDDEEARAPGRGVGNRPGLGFGATPPYDRGRQPAHRAQDQTT